MNHSGLRRDGGEQARSRADAQGRTKMSDPHPITAGLLVLLFGTVLPLTAVGWLLAFH